MLSVPKFEVAVRSGVTGRVVGLLTIEAETSRDAYQLMYDRIRNEEFLEMNNGEIFKSSNLRDYFDLRRIKPSGVRLIRFTDVYGDTWLWTGTTNLATRDRDGLQLPYGEFFDRFKHADGRLRGRYVDEQVPARYDLILRTADATYIVVLDGMSPENWDYPEVTAKALLKKEPSVVAVREESDGECAVVCMLDTSTVVRVDVRYWRPVEELTFDVKA